MKRLDDYIGMKEAKTKFGEMVAMAKYREALKRNGTDVTDTSINMVFEGPPGTGKTEIAGLMADALFEEGVMPGRDGKRVFVSTSAGSLKGEYEGQTIPKVTEAFEAAKGGVLFVDEANQWVASDSAYGQEAMAHLMMLAENNREDTVVILGGYTGLRENLGYVDPGLPRRFPDTVPFKAPDPKERVLIGSKMLSKSQHKMSPSARKKYAEAMAMMPPTASGGDVRNFNSAMITSVSNRYGRSKKEWSPDKLYKITPADVAFAMARYRDGENNPLGTYAQDAA